MVFTGSMLFLKHHNEAETLEEWTLQTCTVASCSSQK